MALMPGGMPTGASTGTIGSFGSLMGGSAGGDTNPSGPVTGAPSTGGIAYSGAMGSPPSSLSPSQIESMGGLAPQGGLLSNGHPNILGSVTTSLNPSSPTGGQVNLSTPSGASNAPAAGNTASTFWGNPKATTAAQSGSLLPTSPKTSAPPTSLSPSEIGSMGGLAPGSPSGSPASGLTASSWGTNPQYYQPPQSGTVQFNGPSGEQTVSQAQWNQMQATAAKQRAEYQAGLNNPYGNGGGQAAGFEQGQGSLVSLAGGNAWVPMGADGKPNFSGLIMAGNPSGQNSGTQGMSYAQMSPAQQQAIVQEIQSSGANFQPAHAATPGTPWGPGWSGASPAPSPAASTPATSGAAAASGTMGTGGTNPTGASAATGATMAATTSGMQPAVTATPASTPSSGSATGTPSNAGGDSQGTMASVSPTASATVGAGTSTSASSLLPTPYTATSFGSMQPVTTPSPSSYVAGYQAQAAGPTSWNVTPQQTVQGQYAQLMASGNPAIQAAMQATLRSYAAHGGGNDLMAQNAAAMSGSAVALSIAGQDAATYAAAGQFNASAANTFNAQLNQFIGNAQLSSQNFQQGMSMLNAQTNQQMTLMAAQVNASAATASINLNAFQQQTAMSLNATLATMNAQFGLNSQAAIQAAGLQSQAAWQQYGMNMRLNYLGQISNLQGNLMNTIGQIQSNPNITATQAQGAVSDAINQFNTYLTQMNAFYGALMPQSGTGTQTMTGGAGAVPAGAGTTPTATGASGGILPAPGSTGSTGGLVPLPASGSKATSGDSGGTMTPVAAGAAPGTYTTPAYNYTYINPSNWPSPSTTTAPHITQNHGGSGRLLAA